ncbi:MAG: alpha/beta hydrolase [Caldilineaceae bacterium]|nr:alpha/beta hydrolase [Caldilineaceae bacterium]
MPSLRSRIVRELWRWRSSRVDADQPIEQMRERLNKMGALLRLPRKTKIEEIEVAGLPAEWITPRRYDERIILFLHGGAYSIGSCASHRGIAAHIAKAGRARALLPEYRLAPEDPFPAALDDAVAVYRELLADGMTPESIVVAGDSAGGGLALSMMVMLCDQGDPLPAAAVLLSPWTDLAATGESIQSCARKDPWLRSERVAMTAARYYGDIDPRDPRVSPLYADLHGLPPLLIQVGDHEILLSDSTRLAERAEDVGVDVTLEVWEGMWHVWHMMVGLMPESQQAIDSIGDFVQRRTQPAPADQTEHVKEAA